MKVGNVVTFYSSNAAQNPDAVLEQAIGQYESVIIIGYDKDGCLDARASANIDTANIAYAVNKFLHDLYSGEYHE